MAAPAALVDRRRFSVQWFSGTILTGLCGAALMGGAVFASLDGETNFAAAPERVETALRGAIAGVGERLSVAHKTDRLPRAQRIERRAADAAGSEQHAGARSRTRAHASLCALAGNLSLTVTELSANIPPFNPQKLLTDGVASADDTPAAEPDAEVSFVTCDFVPNAEKGKVAPATLRPQLAAVEGEAGDAAAARRSASRACATLQARRATGSPLAGERRQRQARQASSSVMLPRATPTPTSGSRRGSCPRTSRCCPRPDRPPTTGASVSVIAKKSETVGSILRELGAAPDEIKALHRRARAGGSRRRIEGRPEAARAADAGRPRPHAAAARHRRRRQRDRGGGGAVRHRQIRRGRRRATSLPRSPKRTKRRPRTTAAACGSTRASTRPRCATMCRTR